MNHHIIYRQKATITVAKEAEAFAVQNEISHVVKNELPQLLQDVLDSITPDGDIIRIDSLQLDLGTLPAQNTGQVFKERVAEKIREAITVKKENSASENGVSIIRKEQSLRESFLYFLQYGTKPWFIGIKNRNEWESGMQQGFAKDDWQKIVIWLRQNHQQQPVVIERLIQQFSDDFVAAVISHTASSGNEVWKDIYHDLFNLFTKLNTTAKAQARVIILQLCLSSFLNEVSLNDTLYHVVKSMAENAFEKEAGSSFLIDVANNVITTNIITGVIERIKRDKSLSATANILIKNSENRIKEESKSMNKHDGKEVIGNVSDGQEFSSADTNEVIEYIPSQAGTGNDVTGNEISTGDKNQSYENTIYAKLSDVAINKASPQNSKTLQSKIEKEPQYVSNAGIVLLHPFLEMYFTEFDLLHKRKFKDDDACKRAVLLLHYLATGETESEEWNLLLQKIMCGLSPDETLSNCIELTDKEKEESERLLQSVINYCPPLKNTSLAGLCSTFLQREGRLEKKENGWLLTVEQKTVDILLDKLPWGFSTIKFPWLADMINVDWC